MQKHYEGHRSRLRKRFLETVGAGWADYELLELLLTYAIPRRDVKPLAKELLEKFGSLSQIFSIDIPVLMKMTGIAESSAVLLKLIYVLEEKYFQEDMMQCPVLNNRLVLEKYLRMKIKDCGREDLFVLFLDHSGRLCSEWCCKGDRAAIKLDVKTLGEKILLTGKNVVSAMIAHNHPSGNCMASANDLKATMRVYNFMSMFGVKLKEHLIITEDQCVSIFGNNNLGV